MEIKKNVELCYVQCHYLIKIVVGLVQFTECSVLYMHFDKHELVVEGFKSLLGNSNRYLVICNLQTKFENRYNI